MIGQARPPLGSAPEAAALLRAALSMWRGEPLADFTFEPFARSEITRLSGLRLIALEDRVEAELALGGHTALCGHLAQLVREHPLGSDYGPADDRAVPVRQQPDAPGAYADLRTTLAEQLGIDPSPELCRLEEAILRQRRSSTGPRAAAGVPTPPVPAMVTASRGIAG
jgi:DNA-binding SARP family transcriptional activator